MQNTVECESVRLSNHGFVLKVTVRATGYQNEIPFETKEEAIKVRMGLERKQLLLSNGSVINIHERVKYEVKPAITLN